MPFKFNPLTGVLDLVDDEVRTVTTASTTSNDNFEIETSTGRIYYWYSGHRYYLGAGTLDDPVISGTMNGLLLALSTL